MHCLPATVPEGEQPRPEVVAARLARRVAPLFGVSWPGNPFRRTWVCDFPSLTLAEIARGAPAPSRRSLEPADATTEGPRPATAEPLSGDDSWQWMGRGIRVPRRAPAPNAVATATLNRFGPDTKSAAVLTAVNRLLRDATAAVAAVTRHLAACDVDPQVRLAVWSGLIVEVYRAQPALVVAGLQARAVQRSLTSTWSAQVAVDALSTPVTSARSELPFGKVPDGMGADEPTDGALHPIRLELVDATAPLLRLDVISGPERLDDLAGAWCRRLLQLGAPGRGLVWLTEENEHRRAQAYVRVGAVVAPFVAGILGGALTERMAQPPPIPAAAELASAPLLHRRAHLVATHVAANVLRYRDDVLAAFPEVRERTRRRLAEAVSLGTAVLDPGDPALLLVRGYHDYLDLWDRGRADTPDAVDAVELEESVRRVLKMQIEVMTALTRKSIDPGAGTYLLEVTAVALTAVRGRLASTADVDRALARVWRTCLAARGLSPDAVLADPEHVHPSHAFHLHHFAEHVAARGRPVDLRRALALQERVCAVRDEVVRREPVGYPAKHAAARAAHELAASLALRLAQALPARDRAGRAAAELAEAEHIAALDAATAAPLPGLPS